MSIERMPPRKANEGWHPSVDAISKFVTLFRKNPQVAVTTYLDAYQHLMEGCARCRLVTPDLREVLELIHQYKQTHP